MNRKRLFYRFVFVSVMFIITSGVTLPAPSKAEDGLKFFSTGEYEKAEAIFNEILKGDAENVQAGYYLGLSLLMQEKYKEALGVFRNLKANIDIKAVMGNAETPTKGQIEIGLVRSYIGLKNYPEALKSLNEAEKAKADPIELHTYKGAYYLEINKNTSANEELEMALKLNPQNPYTYYYAGIANIRLGNPQKAVKLFEIFLNKAPFAPEAEHAKFLIDTLC